MAPLFRHQHLIEEKNERSPQHDDHIHYLIAHEMMYGEVMHLKNI